MYGNNQKLYQHNRYEFLKIMVFTLIEFLIMFLYIIVDENVLYCPVRFDGYVCWPQTKAGVIVEKHCPDFVTGFDKDLIAYKE